MSVPDAAALTALDVTGFVKGQPAYVATYGAYWALQPAASSPAPGGDVVLASSDASLVWVRTGTAVAEQAIAQTTWFIDPLAGNNEATGLTSGAALKSFAEIVRRYGTIEPSIGVAVTITVLTDMAPSDALTLRPIFTAAGSLRVQGTLVQVGTATIGVFTPKNRAAGTDNTITANGQAGAFWTPFVGMTVHDTTSGAQFFVNADLGSATAEITEPCTLPVSYPGSLHAIADGDALVIYRPTQIATPNASAVSATGAVLTFAQATLAGDLTSGNLVGVLGPNVEMLECAVDNLLVETQGQGVSEISPLLVSSSWFGAFFGSGTFTGTLSIASGAMNGSGNFFSDGSILDGDVLLPLRAHIAGTITVGTAYFGQWPTNTLPIQTTAVVVLQSFDFGGPVAWGPATISVSTGQRVTVRTGTAAAALLCAGGALEIDGGSTAFPWNPATNAFLAAVATTAANVDAHSCLQNPATGSRIEVN